MARKNRSVRMDNLFDNVFAELDEQEEQEENVEIEEEIEEKEKTPLADQDQEEEEGFLSRFKRKKEKPSIEETHQRKTFLVRKDLMKELTRLSRKYGYGFQIDFINDAIKNQIRKIKEEEARMKRKC